MPPGCLATDAKANGGTFQYDSKGNMEDMVNTLGGWGADGHLIDLFRQGGQAPGDWKAFTSDSGCGGQSCNVWIGAVRNTGNTIQFGMATGKSQAKLEQMYQRSGRGCNGDKGSSNAGEKRGYTQDETDSIKDNMRSLAFHKAAHAALPNESRSIFLRGILREALAVREGLN